MAAGSLGPRLAGRLTAELILRSPQYMNCVKDYEIDLRGMLKLLPVMALEWHLSNPSLPSNIALQPCSFCDHIECCDILGITRLIVVLSVLSGSKINSIENLGATQVFLELSKWVCVCLCAPVLFSAVALCLSAFLSLVRPGCRINLTALTCQTTTSSSWKGSQSFHA